jgi:hypothetical protein
MTLPTSPPSGLCSVSIMDYVLAYRWESFDPMSWVMTLSFEIGTETKDVLVRASSNSPQLNQNHITSWYWEQRWSLKFWPFLMNCWPEKIFTFFKATQLWVLTQCMTLFGVVLGRSDTRQCWLTNFSRRGHPIAKCISVASVISTHSSRSIFSSKRQLCKCTSAIMRTVTTEYGYYTSLQL